VTADISHAVAAVTAIAARARRPARAMTVDDVLGALADRYGVHVTVEQFRDA
jgi:hypothetical protein